MNFLQHRNTSMRRTCDSGSMINERLSVGKKTKLKNDDKIIKKCYLFKPNIIITDNYIIYT